MVFLNIVFWTAIFVAAFVAIAFSCIAICGYLDYKKYTLRHTYQKLNAKLFMATYHLFPDQYQYDRSEDGYIESLTYTIVEPGGNKFFPNKTEYYILLNFIDYCRVNKFLTKEESAKKRKQISDRETNVVLEDLQKLTREEIEKANREVDDAIADMRKHMKTEKGTLV
jgi:hypothetical protein